MESINNTNQLTFTTFINPELFSSFINRISDFLSVFLTNYSEFDAFIFSNILFEIITTVTTDTTMSVDYCMHLYNQLVRQQCVPFVHFHNQLLILFVTDEVKLQQQLSQKQLVENQVEELITAFEQLCFGVNQMEIEQSVISIPVTTTFIPIDIAPVQLQPLTNNIQFEDEQNHIVVDGLNFFCRMLDTINGTPSSLGYMEEDRKVQQHQFNSQVERARAFEHAKIFFAKAIPQNSYIHIVFKKFGSSNAWNVFVKHFADTFLDSNNSLPHQYDLCVAINEDSRDCECDDRLVARLAIAYNGYILSNDRYRSKHTHWHYDSHYYCIESNTINNSTVNDKIIWDVNNFNANDVNNIPRIDYKFWIGPTDFATGISELCMSFTDIHVF